MKSPTIHVILTVLILLSWEAVRAESPPVPEGSEHRAETQHLILIWNEEVSPQAVELAKAEGDAIYEAVLAKLGSDYALEDKAVVLLEGPAQPKTHDGEWGYPHVDGQGRVHLYEFGGDVHSYMGPFGHELVHVFRRERIPWFNGFLEEAFASFIAYRVDPYSQSFPLYGTPLTVVAGHWMARDQDIPLLEMIWRHGAINLECKAQTYVLRTSFFEYLGRTFGDEKVLELADSESPGHMSDYEAIFGKTFDQLEAGWREDLMAAYAKIEDAEEQARKYRQSPVQYMKACKRGVDFAVGTKDAASEKR